MAVQIRNLRIGKSSDGNYTFYDYANMIFKELFRAGKWETDTYTANNTEYENNVEITASDFAVSDSTPGIVTRVAGGLTGKAGKYITLMSSVNDINRGVFYIDYVIDDYTMRVENPPPPGWTTETGISGRLFSDGRTDPIADNNYARCIPPSGNQAISFTSNNGYGHYLYAYPDGYPGGTHTGGFTTFGVGYTVHEMQMNAYFDGPNGWLLGNIDSVHWILYVFGELEGVGAGDTYPGFVLQCSDLDITGDDQIRDQPLNMLDELLTNCDFQMALYNNGTQTLAVSGPNVEQLQKRNFQGKAKLEKIWAYSGATGSGGYPRGKIPHIRMTNRHWEKWRAMSSSYDWFHLAAGICLPMMGANDILPRPR